MIEAINSPPSPSNTQTTYSTTGTLGDRIVTVLDLEDQTEELYTYLQSINEPPNDMVDFTAALLNDFELQILQEMIIELHTTLESINPDELPSEEMINFKKLPEQESHSAEQKSLPKKSISNDWTQSLSSNQINREIIEQRNSFSKMMRYNKESTAPFFSIPTAQIEKKQDRSREAFAFNLPSDLPPPFFPTYLNTMSQEQKSSHDQREQTGDEQNNDSQEQKKQKAPTQNSSKKIQPIRGIYATTSSSISSHESSPPPLKETGDVFHHFLLLMERILGQAQAEAHQLYQKIKARTDQVEVLTKLIGKLNLIDGKVDWSKDEEMKALIQQARAIGVEIPENKYSWSKDEKRYLLENIQMRKDTMEKMTQLERTDMQRYMQEASHCHQARSNILKLMKEITDTIIHNLRPG